jgi:putative membrane protein insertion efficiency factor
MTVDRMTHDHTADEPMAGEPMTGDTSRHPGAPSLAARVLLAPIVAYRRWISPGLPPRCRFYPSCSEYAVTAITTHGPIRGLGLAVWRLLRCQPFHPGGIDHVPPPRTKTAATTRLEQ